MQYTATASSYLIFIFSNYFKKEKYHENKKIILGIALAAAATALLSNCASIPKKAKAVRNFDANKYLGTWYEIARFDYRFEKTWIMLPRNIA
jgi:Bacterial lipocalin